MIFVREMDRSWLQFVKGDPLGMGVTLASFQWQGINCSCNERLNSFVIIGAKGWEKSLHIQWGSPYGTSAVRFCRADNLSTVCTSRAGIRVPGGIGIRLEMEYAGSVFIFLKYWLIAHGLKIELTFGLPRFLPVILCTVSHHFFDPVSYFLFSWRIDCVWFLRIRLLRRSCRSYSCPFLMLLFRFLQRYFIKGVI